MTNAIGAGTANITYNGPTEEAQILGKLAFSMKIPRCELLRRAVLLGVQQMRREAAEQINAVREERLRLKRGLVCLAVGCVSIFHAMATDGEIRRSRNTHAPVRPAIRRNDTV